MKPFALSPPLADELLHHALRSPEAEICGLISGDNNGLTCCYPIGNIAPDPERSFEMDPKEQVAALRHMEENGEELRAIYHSHPHGPPFPSATDIAQHQYPDVLFIVISLAPRGYPEIRGFFIRNQQVEEIDIDVGAA